MTKHQEVLESIKRALDKLANSKTPLTRKRGRRVFRKAVNAAMKAFPNIGRGADGEVIEKVGKKLHAACCPACGVPLRTWEAFHTHVQQHVGEKKSLPDGRPILKREIVRYSDSAGTTTREVEVTPHGCRCCDRIFKNTAAVSKHLSDLNKKGKLVAHVIDAATAHAFSFRREG